MPVFKQHEAMNAAGAGESRSAPVSDFHHRLSYREGLVRVKISRSPSEGGKGPDKVKSGTFPTDAISQPRPDQRLAALQRSVVVSTVRA
jgi:hypothetical protein